MKKCLRCNTVMIENFDLKIEGSAYGIKITQQGIFKDNLGKLKCAVCPKCGYTETYIDDASKVANIAKEEQKSSIEKPM